jgi:hypothetical protein
LFTDIFAVSISFAASAPFILLAFNQDRVTQWLINIAYAIAKAVARVSRLVTSLAKTRIHIEIRSKILADLESGSKQDSSKIYSSEISRAESKNEKGEPRDGFWQRVKAYIQRAISERNDPLPRRERVVQSPDPSARHRSIAPHRRYNFLRDNYDRTSQPSAPRKRQPSTMKIREDGHSILLIQEVLAPD